MIKRMKILVLCAMISTITLISCNNTLNEDEYTLGTPITKLVNLSEVGKGVPVLVCSESPAEWDRGELKKFPQRNGAEDYFAIDLRSYNLSKFDLNKYQNELKYLLFDTNTQWPDKLPDEFEPDTILELGKNPGLGIRALHEQGITGRGVSIAIIDSVLFLEHKEYKENIMLYEMLHYWDGESQMHGPAVVSIAVGKQVGVAPEAKVYYIASTFGNITLDGGELDLVYVANGIFRVLEINQSLPEDEKIRVISISIGLDEREKGYTAAVDAIGVAKEAGVFVITVTPQTNYEFFLTGLGRCLYDNPDDVNSYGPGLAWEEDYYNNSYYYTNPIPENGDIKYLLVPMDSRTYASCRGESEYAFGRQGGNSWICPWLAGMYALCVQVKPDIEPEEFIRIACQTGNVIRVQHEGMEYRLGRIINPASVIDKLLSND